jgi:hypothetical protein
MITNRLVALIRVKPLHKSLLSMVNQQRFLASPTKVLLLEDKQRNKEADTGSSNFTFIQGFVNRNSII